MINEPFKITVQSLTKDPSGQYEFEVQPDDLKSLDVLSVKDNAFHVLKNGQSYHAELVQVDYDTRLFTFLIAGNKYEVKISDYYERLVRQLGLTTGGTHKMNIVKAPMPGLVLNIMVEPGQTVEKGDPLIILEAMKMENVIKAAGEGRVKAIKVLKGTAVDKGQLLIELD
jgi:biotin carboxyl carrier protein